MNRKAFFRAATVIMAGALVACAASSNDGGATDMAMKGVGGNGGSGGSGGGGGSAGSGGTGGTGGSGGTGGQIADMAMPASQGMLPFVVDSEFVSSGYMGDGATAGTISMVPSKGGDSTSCNGNRSSVTAVGSCHVVTYTPPASGGMGWGGVYWQYPANNWGTKPGFTIPSGATKVSFQARGMAGGEKVSFLAGGIINAGAMYTDSLKASSVVTLTNAWAAYSIDLTGQTYSSVLGAFGWTMVATDAGASGTFYVDDIQWQ